MKPFTGTEVLRKKPEGVRKIKHEENNELYWGGGT